MGICHHGLHKHRSVLQNTSDEHQPSWNVSSFEKTQNSSGLVDSSPGEISRKHGNKLEQVWYTLRQKSEGNFKIFK